LNLIDFSIRRPVTIAMIFVATVVFGFVALSRLDLKLLPEISYPTLTVQTEYPDAAPAEVENFVTRPLEEAVGVVNGLRLVRSVSKPGMSEITLEFAWKTPMQYVALDVRDKIDLVQLPRECEDPVILRYDPALDPIVRIGVFGEDNMMRLRYIADRTIKKELEAIDGVASAKVLGGLEEEIQVELDERKLASYGIPITQVATRLSQENINQSGGRLRDKGAEFLLRTENEFKSVEEIAHTIVREEDGRKVILADLGRVSRGYEEREIITRLNGEEVVEVAIHKEGDANTVEVADAVKQRLAVLQQQLPEGVQTKVLFDQSRFIKKSISEVRSNAILGAILAILILYIFLRDGRSTFIIGLSIPISIMFTFVMMRQLGVSLNLMSLGGLALGVGMLVDNSIVVLESISRHKERGLDRRTATSKGAGEVSRAVIASTLTTISVFLPIVFVEGFAGQVFKDQALTVSVSLLASLIVALMLIPMVSALRLRVAEPEARVEKPPSKKKIVRGFKKSSRFLFFSIPVMFLRLFRKLLNQFARLTSILMRPLLSGFNRLYGAVERGYDPALRWTLAHRVRFLLSMVALFVVSLLSASFIGQELIPPFSQGEFSFNMLLPEGSPLEATDKKMQHLEELTARMPEVESYFTSIGIANRVGSNVKTRDKNLGQLNVVMAQKGSREAEEALVAKMRRQFDRVPGIQYKFSRPAYFSYQTPVEIHVFGYNLEVLKQFSDELAAKVATIDGLKDVKTSLEYGNPELNVHFDRVRLSSLGLSLNEVSNTLKTKIKGDVPTTYKEREKQVDIRVRTSAWRSEDIESMRSLVVSEQEGRPITLGTVADVQVARGLNQISRISQQRAAVISANISGRDLGGVSQDIRRVLASTRVPSQVTVELGGQNEELLDSYRNLKLALLLAVFLVYLVMAAQFESFIHPFIIMFTVPLGAIGVFFTLLLFGKSLSIVVFIGAIMLSGIVVNNGIVLIDYINQLRQRGESAYDAIVEAARVRLRPILMTTLTTVLGLLPMALATGEGAEIRAPMALTVIGGLLGATILTLLVIPSLYAVVSRAKAGA
jgi:HAE1 family hydrophobic/amphiphilic exporter-1